MERSIKDIDFEYNQILTNNDSIKQIDALNELAYKIRYSNPEKSIEIANKSLQLSKEKKYDKGEYVARMHIAFGHFLTSKEYPILQELIAVHKFLKEYPTSLEYSIVLNYIGNVYDSLGEYQKGLTYCHEALKTAQENHYTEAEGDAYSTTGLIMTRICDYKNAILNFEKSLEIRRSLNNKAAIASSLNLLGRTYALVNKFELSEEYYKKAIDLRIEINELAALSFSYIGIASLYEKQHKNDQALEYYFKAIEASEINKDKRCLLHCYLGLGRIYIQMLENEKTKEYIDKAIEIAKELHANPLLYEGYEILSKYYEHIGNVEKAYESFKNFHEIKERVLNAQVHSTLKNQQIAFEVERIQKDAEIYQLRNVELKNAYDILENKTQEILDSIEYAKKIQKSLLPPQEYINHLFKEGFILYRPKSIVSGDFYWFHNNNKKYVVVADCTGHGVPGAFMSILGINLLNEIITKYENIEVNDILNELRSRVISLLKQTIDFNSIKDGMDISICCIDEKRNILEYAGAFSTTYLIKDKNLIEIKGDRMPIGIHEEINTKFSKQNIEIEKDMKIYLFSDGYMDQFGGENNRKLKSKGFQQIVYKISELPMNEQKEKFEEALINWMGSNEQIDDITLIGIKI